MISAALRRTRLALQCADESEPLYWVRMSPMTLPSRSNASNLHHFGRAKLAKNQRFTGLRLLRIAPPHTRGVWAERLATQQPLVVRITREAPKPLDDDNLAGACKSLRDGIADALGVDDRDSRVVWLCDQTKAKAPSVLVEIYAMRGGK